jgi:small-conductance mechanosensitive channel
LVGAAGVLGVAVGFGAQGFVRDVIAGMFYLMDDAFRVGEYISAGNYKGTVEGFSIRSVKLRHHRGPVYTVPFSLLGAVQNQSRDWVIDKIAIGVTYDSDLTLAKKLIKQIGLDLAKDPEYAPLILEPLKMQGVDNLGDFRGPAPREDDDLAGRAVRHPAAGLCNDQKGVRRERHQIRLPDRAGRR